MLCILANSLPLFLLDMQPWHIIASSITGCAAFFCDAAALVAMVPFVYMEVRLLCCAVLSNSACHAVLLKILVG